MPAMLAIPLARPAAWLKETARAVNLGGDSRTMPALSAPVEPSLMAFFHARTVRLATVQHATPMGPALLATLIISCSQPPAADTPASSSSGTARFAQTS